MVTKFACLCSVALMILSKTIAFVCSFFTHCYFLKLMPSHFWCVTFHILTTMTVWSILVVCRYNVAVFENDKIYINININIYERRERVCGVFIPLLFVKTFSHRCVCVCLVFPFTFLHFKTPCSMESVE